MKCPFCRAETTDVINSRPTHHQAQIWRRRQCLSCREIFTTYERAEVGFIKVIKKTGRKERYSRAKLFASIYRAFTHNPPKQNIADEATDLVEGTMLDRKQKTITSEEIAQLVLPVLKQLNTSAFVRYLTYQADITSEGQLVKELKKYRVG